MLYCTTCQKRDDNLHPTLHICLDCFQAGEPEKEKRMKIVDLDAYRNKRIMQQMSDAYSKALSTPSKRR